MSSSPHEQPGSRSRRSWLADSSWRLTPNCREVARLTSEALDRPVGLTVRIRLGVHRCFCRWCARYARQLDFLHEAGAQFDEHAERLSEPVLAVDVRARLKRALR